MVCDGDKLFTVSQAFTRTLHDKAIFSLTILSETSNIILRMMLVELGDNVVLFMQKITTGFNYMRRKLITPYAREEQTDVLHYETHKLCGRRTKSSPHVACVYTQQNIHVVTTCQTKQCNIHTRETSTISIIRFVVLALSPQDPC
jgi:hypothetical protein